jgi:tetratricopeptide (TPR) repeat protein
MTEPPSATDMPRTGVVDGRVAGYLGRVLGGDEPVGTCFQVAPGTFVTALHVLEQVGANRVGDTVTIDALAGGIEPFTATVNGVHLSHDLAIVSAPQALPASVPGWVSSDSLSLDTAVAATGVSAFADPGHTHRHLDAAGVWAGGTMRDDHIPLGRMRSPDVVAGMSGAPVLRRVDGYVVGVISARYNSADGWLRDSVWITRSEDVRALLRGTVDIQLEFPPLSADSFDLTLAVGDSQVRLFGSQLDVSAQHQGITPGLQSALSEVHRERARAASLASTRTNPHQMPFGDSVETFSLRRAGELAGESFLPSKLSLKLASLLEEATRRHQPLRLGIDPGSFGSVPWEAIPDPVTGKPLALHPLVHLYRRVPGAEPVAIPGPLRIVVAIAAPTESGGAVLDYERELRTVLSAVRVARHDAADVRVVEYATTGSIRAALAESPAHVLHLSGHGVPGLLIIEDEEGLSRPTSAEDFIAEAIPPGRMPPVISLAACYTDVAAGLESDSFATKLMRHGASAVVATETSVTDRYATALFSRVYQELSQNPTPDVVSAVCDVRRLIQRQLTGSEHPRDSQLAGLDEWATVTVLSNTPTNVVFDPQVSGIVQRRKQALLPGLPARSIGDFVGRRDEKRQLAEDLACNQFAGVVVSGIGGVGKTALAEQLVAAHQPSSLLLAVAGQKTIDELFAEVLKVIVREEQLRRDLGISTEMLRAAQYANNSSLPWQDRFAALRTSIFEHIPMLVVLDNFDDNLDANRALIDEQFAELLSAWVTDNGLCRFIFTSRFPFDLPNAAQNRLRRKDIGPLLPAETFKLIWSLPMLDRLEDREIERIWRLVGGHPRSLEYLDALLNGGTGANHAITAQLAEAIAARDDTKAALTSDTLDGALATAVTLVADGILLDRLLDRLDDFQKTLLVVLSVFRQPIIKTLLGLITGFRDANAVSPVTGEADPFATTDRYNNAITSLVDSSLLSMNESGWIFVHRWTASELEDLCKARGLDEFLTFAHKIAWLYWITNAIGTQHGVREQIHCLLQAYHHSLQAGAIEAAEQAMGGLATHLNTVGAWDMARRLIEDLLERLGPDSPSRARWLQTLAAFVQRQGDVDGASLLDMQAIMTQPNVVQDHTFVGIGFHNQAVIAAQKGMYEFAESQLKMAIWRFDQADNQPMVASSQLQLGNIVAALGRRDEARDKVNEGLRIYSSLPDWHPEKKPGIALAQRNLAGFASGEGKQEEAERLILIAEGIYTELNDRRFLAECIRFRGELALDDERHERARVLLDASLDISTAIPDTRLIAHTRVGLGKLAYELGDYDEAHSQFDQAYALFEPLYDNPGMAQVWSGKGEVFEAQSRIKDAIQSHIQALLIHIFCRSPQCQQCFRALAPLRNQFGHDNFRQPAQEINTPQLSNLERRLDQIDLPQESSTG